MTIAFSDSLGTWFVRKQCVRRNFACTKSLSNLLNEATLSVLNARLGAQYSLWRTNNFVFVGLWSQDSYFWEAKKSIQDVICEVYCPAGPNETSFYLSTNKSSSFYHFKKCKGWSHVLNINFKDQTSTIILIGGNGTHRFARKTSRVYKKEKPSPLLNTFLNQSQSSTRELESKKAKIIPVLAKIIPEACRLPIG